VLLSVYALSVTLQSLYKDSFGCFLSRVSMHSVCRIAGLSCPGKPSHTNSAPHTANKLHDSFKPIIVIAAAYQKQYVSPAAAPPVQVWVKAGALGHCLLHQLCCCTASLQETQCIQARVFCA
jgi:hypothetical protein